MKMHIFAQVQQSQRQLCITWLSTIQQDLKQHHLMLPEATNLAQNRPPWRMMSTYGSTQSWVACQKWWSAKSRMDANMHVTINCFRSFFPDISLTFSKIPDISLTAIKFPDISRLSRQVLVTLITAYHYPQYWHQQTQHDCLSQMFLHNCLLVRWEIGLVYDCADWRHHCHDSSLTSFQLGLMATHIDPVTH